MDYIINMTNEYGNLASVLALAITLGVLLIGMIKKLQKRLENSKKEQDRFKSLTTSVIKELTDKGTNQPKRQEINMLITVLLNRLQVRNTRYFIIFGTFVILFLIMIFSTVILFVISNNILYKYLIYLMILLAGLIISYFNTVKKLYEIESVIESDYKKYLNNLIEKY